MYFLCSTYRSRRASPTPRSRSSSERTKEPIASNCLDPSPSLRLHTCSAEGARNSARELLKSNAFTKKLGVAQNEDGGPRARRSTAAAAMGVQKRTRKFATVKRIIGQRDARLKKNQLKGETEARKKVKGDEVVREIPQVSSVCLPPTATCRGPLADVSDSRFSSSTTPLSSRLTMF